MLNIKELRLQYGLSQAALSKKTGIPKGRINNWEQGNGKPKAEDLATLLRFFHLNNDESIPRGTQENPVTERSDQRLIEIQEKLILNLEKEVKRLTDELRALKQESK